MISNAFELTIFRPDILDCLQVYVQGQQGGGGAGAGAAGAEEDAPGAAETDQQPQGSGPAIEKLYV